MYFAIHIIFNYLQNIIFSVSISNTEHICVVYVLLSNSIQMFFNHSVQVDLFTLVQSS